MCKKILVPVDGSDCSNRTVMYAAKIAEKLQSEITLIHVLPPLPTYVSNYSEQLEKLEKTLMHEFTKEALDILKKSKQLINDKNVPVHTELIIGNPQDEICKFAKDHSYDLIIIGSRGLSGIKSYIMGSVSNRVSKHAHCPVLIYRN